MMKFLKYNLIFLILFLISCHKDKKEKIEPPRDENEVYHENLNDIEAYLETHFYYLKETTGITTFWTVAFDTISGDNADKTPLIKDEALKSKTVKAKNQDYKVYYLEIRKGAEEEYQPTFADKLVMTYTAMTMDGDKFQETPNPIVIDIPMSGNALFNMGQIRGTIVGVTEFKGATDFTENSDGTLNYTDDYGIGAVFVPSGLAFFQNPPVGSGIGQYRPFIFSFQLYKGIQMDHDDDGIPSYMEDLEGSEILYDTDTDKDGTSNFADPDDDGDGVPTKDEIIIHETDRDWLEPEDIEFPDTNGSGIPDYLDPKI